MKWKLYDLKDGEIVHFSADNKRHAEDEAAEIIADIEGDCSQTQAKALLASGAYQLIQIG